MKTKMLCGLVLALLAGPALPAARASSAEPMFLSLAGQWRFQLDPGGKGMEDKWFNRTLPGAVNLPGSLPAQDIGDPVTVDTKWMGDIVDKSWYTAPEYAKYRTPANLKVPFWLQPGKYYAGAAWYQRDVVIPDSFAGKRVVLTLERPHWETRAWIDGRPLGTNNSLSTAHEYDLGMQLTPGKHQITIRVDNSLIVDVGVNSHSITDHTQGNWNGIVGAIGLRTTGLVWIEDLQVYPQLATRSIKVKGRLGNATGLQGKGEISFSGGLNIATPFVRLTQMPRQLLPVEWGPAGTNFEATLSLGNVFRTWDEFNPTLLRLAVGLSEHDVRVVSVGMREISAKGSRLQLNGHNVFLRGTLECCIFPETGHPPTDEDSWLRILKIARAHGLNLIRFHSWCPPEAAFSAADQLGFYFQVEIASWANQSTTLGDGKPVDAWLYQEADRILKAYGNHPSFLLMPYGNEPGGKNANAWLAKWVEHWKAADSRRLYTSGSGWPQLPENQFHVTPDPRIQAWGQGLKSRINALPPETVTDYRAYIQQRNVPVISHEIGQWCVYPNFDEIAKYTGYLKPRNFEIFRDSLNEHHLGDLARQFLLASGKLQTLCYKEDIESALRTPGMAGFELLDLHDFPGQGTALVGVLDPFWDSKGYVTPEEYRRFCNYTVPLARLSKRVFTTAEKLEADVEVAHFGSVPASSATNSWRLATESGQVVASGTLPTRDLPLDNAIPLGKISIDLRDIKAPARYKLAVTVAPAVPKPDPRDLFARKNVLPQRFENDWDIWVYPPKVATEPAAGVTLATDLDDKTLAALNQGGKVLLTIPRARVKGDQLGPVELGFSSIFWNTAWTHRQPPHTLGILCDPASPALASFPTDFHSNWQWWYLVSRGGAMILDGLPQELRPTVQVIDDWVTNRKLGLVFEGRIGRGKLVVCSVDLPREDNLVARQMLHSLLEYMAGDKFQPAVELTAAQVRGLMTPATP